MLWLRFGAVYLDRASRRLQRPQKLLGLAPAISENCSMRPALVIPSLLLVTSIALDAAVLEFARSEMTDAL